MYKEEWLIPESLNGLHGEYIVEQEVNDSEYKSLRDFEVYNSLAQAFITSQPYIEPKEKSRSLITSKIRKERTAKKKAAKKSKVRNRK